MFARFYEPLTIISCSSFYTGGLSYTLRCFSRNVYSSIDNFFPNAGMFEVCAVDITENALNFSDHLQVLPVY